MELHSRTLLGVTSTCGDKNRLSTSIPSSCSSCWVRHSHEMAGVGGAHHRSNSHVSAVVY